MKAVVAVMQFSLVVVSAFPIPIPPSPIAVSAKALVVAQIVDEETHDGVAGMTVACRLPSLKNVFGDMEYTIATDVTDESGKVRFSGRIYDDAIQCFVAGRNGYYQLPCVRIQFTNITEGIFREWLPYGEIQRMTLQKIGKPIPLFVQHEDPRWFRDLTTEPDKKFCYDLVKGAWLPPFGKGVQADIEFKLLPRKDFGVHIGLSGYPGRSYRDEIVLRFIGDGNGIVSVLPPPNAVLKIREAPLEGYEQQHVSWRGRNKDIQPEQSDGTEKCQAFRIRTKRNAEGKIASALYGKVYGGFPLVYMTEGRPSGVEFTYYLNPTPNDRNLEWDMEHNLCPVRETFNCP